MINFNEGRGRRGRDNLLHNLLDHFVALDDLFDLVQVFD